MGHVSKGVPVPRLSLLTGIIVVSFLVCNTSAAEEQRSTTADDKTDNGQARDKLSSGADETLESGHMDFFGASGTVKDIESVSPDLKPPKFLNEYILARKPVLLQGSSRHFPAFDHWQRDDHLISRPQAFTSWVSVLDESSTEREVTVRNFLQRYVKKNWHINTEVPLFMWDDMYLPDCMICNVVMKQMSQNLLWYSGRDSFQQVVQRVKDGMKCVMSGTVEVTLVDPAQFSQKMPDDVSTIDVKRVNLTRFPGLRNVGFVRSSVSPGDCIYLPAQWFQQVNSYGRTISVDVTFHRHDKSVSEKDCRGFSANQTLGHYHFQDQLLPYTTDQDFILHHFITYVLNKVKLPYETFRDILKKDRSLLANMTEWTEEFDDITQELFQSLDVDTDGEFSLQDVENLSQITVQRLRGLLTDRLADYGDIIADQQADVQAKSQKGLDPLTQAFITEYVEQLEGVLVQSIDQFVRTGTMPDIKSKMANIDAKQQLGVGQGETSAAGKKEKETTEHYTSREDAKAKLQAHREKKEVEKTSKKPESPDENEVYVLVNENDEEEEILADEEAEVQRDKPGQKGIAPGRPYLPQRLAPLEGKPKGTDTYRKILLGPLTTTFEAIKRVISTYLEIINFPKSAQNWTAKVGQDGTPEFVGVTTEALRFAVVLVPGEGINLQVQRLGPARGLIREVSYQTYHVTYSGFVLRDEGTTLLYGSG
ncbi:uncharacterized protein LOC135461794 [Liolophura sinensis]|uniref:uncharacterized protein LOC135461794 n=1 Tax=Liolophura sinensis TaxID=3198878 RepID=UPI003158426C